MGIMHDYGGLTIPYQSLPTMRVGNFLQITKTSQMINRKKQREPGRKLQVDVLQLPPGQGNVYKSLFLCNEVKNPFTQAVL